MCGIAGYIHKDPSRPVDPETLVAMAAIQYHRGPDGYGWEAIQDRGVGMSHARLAIIDLRETGRQPFLSEDGQLLLAHNGEFYDYQRIRAELTARGARFKSKSDSEMVLHLYPRYGLEATLKYLRGEFAFSLFDRKTDKLFLVRDRFGIKPQYWARAGDTIVFGSEIKVIFAHPEVKRVFDSAGLYHQLMQTIVPGSTPFLDVHQVKPGHYVTFERKNGDFRIEEKPYWDVDFPLEHEREERSEEYWIDLVREKLAESVQHRLVADVPVGCYLSGGIDSCAILGLSAAARQDDVKAFTIGFDSDRYDESVIATEMAESVGADQDIMRLDATHLYDHLVDTHWHTERTIYNTLGVAKYLMSKHVNEVNYKVVLTGEGSDELFGGYPSFRRDMFMHGLDHLSPGQRAEWQKMLQESNELFRGAMLAAEEITSPALDAMAGFTPSCLQPWLSAGTRVPGILNADRNHELNGYDPGAAIASAIDGEMLKGRHPLDIAQYVWIKTQLEGQILTWGGDRVDMANSMEARPPFLDHHLAEAAVHVPPEMRIKGRTEKYVLREAMKGLLPRTLYEREKFAFMAPPAHTDEKKLAALRALSDDYLSSDAVKNSGLLDEGGVRKLWDMYTDPATENSTLVQLDAVLNHSLGVQILDRHLVQADIPAQAKAKAKELGWTV